MHVSPHSTTRLLPGWRPQVMGCCMTQSRKPLALGALHDPACLPQAQGPELASLTCSMQPRDCFYKSGFQQQP